MGLTLKGNKEDNWILGREYNIEYELGNGRLQTFSNTLENIDGTYFWFNSEEDGLDVIRQDRIVTMTCIRNRNRFE